MKVSGGSPPWCMALVLSIGAVAFAAHGRQAAGSNPIAAAQDILAGMRVVVAADGSVTSVVPDAALPEPIRTGLVKRVSQWHYTVPRWQEQAVATSMREGLRLQLVPTTGGGYALRIVGTAYVPDPEYDFRPPVYPAWLLRKGVGATLIYAVRIGIDGRATDVRLRHPEGALDRAAKAFDESARAAIVSWSWPSQLANGAPVACDVLYPVVFGIRGRELSARPDRELLESGLQLCPKAELQTLIDGTLL